MPDTSANSNRRAVVNVATDRYVPLQDRLKASLDAVAWSGGRVLATEFPEGSLSHLEAPYAFKLQAFLDASARGFSTLLWLDAPCVAEQPLEPLFERIEREGILLVTGGDRLGNWSGDAALAAYGLTRDEAMAFPLMNGSFIGLDLTQPVAARWFKGLFEAAALGLFAGAYLSEHAPADVRARKPGKPVGHVSDDPRCWGHRHDEAIGSILAQRARIPLEPQGGTFDAEGDPRAIIRLRK